MGAFSLPYLLAMLAVGALALALAAGIALRKVRRVIRDELTDGMPESVQPGIISKDN